MSNRVKVQAMSTTETPTTENLPLPDELKAHLAERFKLSHGTVSQKVLGQIQSVEQDRLLNPKFFPDPLKFLMNNFPFKFSQNKRDELDGAMPEWSTMSLEEWGYTDLMPPEIRTLLDVHDSFGRHMSANGLQEDYERLLTEKRAEVRDLVFPIFIEMAEEGFTVNFLRQ